ncbi:hypothetical protein [Variovorax sp. YR752]|uniref:hypothetical protein n=1 Tax=Variovorax sp. YR752 TaxID=1884383 RepID=UPI0031379EBC
MPRPTVLPLIVLAALLASEAAQAHGRHGRWHGGLSIGIGVPLYLGPHGGYYGGPWVGYPAPVIVAPPVVYAEPPAPPMPPPKAPPDPIFYPRQGQGAAQLEADRQECNRWATTQPSAMADAGVFHRATLACMDGRGYSAR